MTPIFEPIFRQLSNDTYFFFKFGEEPLDAANYEEIEELKAEFPNGFELADEYEYIEDDPDAADLIRVQLFPYDLENEGEELVDYYEELSLPEYDQAMELFNNWLVCFTRLADDLAHAFFYNTVTGKLMKEGEWPIKTTKTGNEYLAIGNCQFPLKRFTPF